MNHIEEVKEAARKEGSKAKSLLLKIEMLRKDIAKQTSMMYVAINDLADDIAENWEYKDESD